MKIKVLSLGVNAIWEPNFCFVCGQFCTPIIGIK